MNLLRLAALTVSAVCTSMALAGPGTFNLNASSFADLYSLGGPGVSDPQSSSFTLPTSVGSVSSVAHTANTATGEWATTTMNVSASLADAFHGSITYDDKWETHTFPPYQGAVYMSGVSDYTFVTAATNSVLDVNYSAILSHTGTGTGNFGMGNIILTVDGKAYVSPSFQWVLDGKGWKDPDTSGSWQITNLGAGSHTITFHDGSNISAGIDTRMDSMKETLNFSVSAAAVPEPTSILVLAVGSAPILIRKRKK